MLEIMPNPGRIKMYTSGCPKNQNKCWNKIGSPPPQGSKNEVLRFRSVRSMVIAAAKTGRARRSIIAVIMTDQTKSGILNIGMEAGFILMQVVIKLIAPRIDEAPARCSEKIAKSTDGPEWTMLLESGGYTVQPVPAPASTYEDDSNSKSAGGNSQKLMLFIRGKAISGAPIISGISQFPNPPIIIGITMKKIIMKAWAVTNTLKIWSLPNRVPGWVSSIRIRMLRQAPINPDQAPNRRYRVPISLWFVENSQRVMYTGSMAEIGGKL